MKKKCYFRTLVGYGHGKEYNAIALSEDLDDYPGIQYGLPEFLRGALD